ncbi:unnamed protein product [Effrenium voratum]|nr:unnamed protein product [Effrenium voratum]
MMDMSDYKVAIFETLCAAALWPSLKGRIAGSGVLGVITATLLSPRHPASSKALMARLCGVLAADSPEAVQLGDGRRAEEFAKLRRQLIASGAVKAIAALAKEGAGEAAAAAAKTVAQFAGTSGDAEIRAELTTAEVVPSMLNRLCSELQSENEDAEPDTALEAIALCLSQLAAAEGDGCGMLVEALLSRDSLAKLCGVLRSPSDCFSEQRRMIEHVLCCLQVLGLQHSCWPDPSQELAEDLYRLVVLRCDTAASYLEALVRKHGAKAFLTQFGDVRPLRRALLQLSTASASSVGQALDAVQSCHQCGIISQKNLLACSSCRQVAYCSQECQRADWKQHKLSCQR